MSGYHTTRGQRLGAHEGLPREQPYGPPRPVACAAPPSAVAGLLDVLHCIDGNALCLSPKLRGEWRGLAVRLAMVLAAKGVRAPT